MTVKTINQPASTAENLKGSAYMTIAMAGFAVNDTFVKSVGETLNVGQSLFLRGCFASLLVFIAAKMLGQWRSPKQLFNPLILFRMAGDLLATGSFVTAIFNMPLGNATAILQALPLALTAAAAFFFGEQVGWRRMIAIIIGFIGVLIVVRPGLDGFTNYSLLVLLAVLGCVIRDLSTRIIPNAVPAMMITLTTAIGVTLMGAVMAIFQPWNPVDAPAIGKLAFASVFLVIGYYFVVITMRIGDVGFISPFRYSVLIFAMIGGFIFFNEIPDQYTIAGSLIIVITGIYTLYRERVVKSQAITPPPSRS